ncbi:MAG: hypothetical protein LBS18_07330 [Clostridiales bacterium]|jgi:hypothetical protein|nr:hypothetical protein [Clostridiales bacterium]
MKKFVTLTIVLALMLGLAAPALAYTTNVPAAGSSKYAIDVYLVEHSTAGLLSLNATPVDRGYARNEIVSAIAAFTIPANGDLYADGYRQIVLAGKNASLYVTDNNLGANGQAETSLTTSFPFTNNASPGFHAGKFIWSSADNTIAHNIGDPASVAGNEIAAPGKAATYRILFFAKVLDDKAELSAALSTNAAFLTATATWKETAPFSTAVPAAAYLELNDDYVVARDNKGNYFVFTNTGTLPGTLLFKIGVKANGKTDLLEMYNNGAAGAAFRIYAEPSQRELIFTVVKNKGLTNFVTGDQVKYGTAMYSSLRYMYDTHFETGLGFTAFNEGNILTDKDFIAIGNSGDVADTVAIAPWSPYVQMPEITIVNPPKTGEAACLTGFVIIALAVACAALVKKVRA